MTYMLPGYTEYYEEDGVLYISSKLLQNKVKITEAIDMGPPPWFSTIVPEDTSPVKVYVSN